MSDSATRLAIFAKVPRLGQVKTRLEPMFGAEGCLLLHQCLIEQAIELASNWSLGPVELWLADELQEGDLRLDVPSSVSIKYQEGKDLGMRMQYALQSAVSGGDSVVLIGTDSPQQKLSHLEEAASLLEADTHIVVQPAFDGGFVLIGCSTMVPDMSAGIDWGTERVFDQLQEELSKQSLSCLKIETISDLDIKEDILLLQEDKDSFLSSFYVRLELQKNLLTS